MSLLLVFTHLLNYFRGRKTLISVKGYTVYFHFRTFDFWNLSVATWNGIWQLKMISRACAYKNFGQRQLLYFCLRCLRWIMWLVRSYINSIHFQRFAALIWFTAKEHKSLVVKVLDNLFQLNALFIVTLFLFSRRLCFLQVCSLRNNHEIGCSNPCPFSHLR